MKGRQQYDIDIIQDATTTLRKNGFAGDGESHIEDSMQIILEPGRERRLLTAERDGLRIERDGFFPQATEAAALANLSCPKDQVIPSLVQIATNLSTQVKNAQNASNNMVADHAEEVRLLKLAVEDEKKTASDCRSETHRPKAEIKGLEQEIVHLSGLLAPDSSLEAPDGGPHLERLQRTISQIVGHFGRDLIWLWRKRRRVLGGGLDGLSFGGILFLDFCFSRCKTLLSFCLEYAFPLSFNLLWSSSLFLSIGA